MVTDWLKMVIEQGATAPGYEVRAAAVGSRAVEMFRIVAARRRAARSGAAGHRRHRAAAADEGDRRVAGDDRDQRRRHDHARARSRAGRRVLLHREIESRSRRHRVDPRSRHRPAGRARAARAAQGAGARSVRLLEHHRQEQEDARALRAGRGGRRERRQHPDPGRERRRQGADRQRDSRAQRPRQGAVHQDQLRGAAEGADRVGAVRLQEGRVHRRDHRQGRPARARRAADR